MHFSIHEHLLETVRMYELEILMFGMRPRQLCPRCALRNQQRLHYIMYISVNFWPPPPQFTLIRRVGVTSGIYPSSMSREPLILSCTIPISLDRQCLHATAAGSEDV